MNRVRLTVDDLRRAADAEVRAKWSGRQWVRWLDAAAVLRDQTFRNVVLIKLQMPEATWVAGRETWQRTGHQIARRQSGIRIIAPANNHRLDLEAGSLQGHGVATVWDVSQTNGLPSERLPERPEPSTTPRNVRAALVRVANSAGYSVSCEPEATNHARRRTIIIEDIDDVAAATSISHELAHARMHKSARGSACHGLNELEAESVTYLLLSHFGLPVGGSSVSLTAAAARISKRHPERTVQTLGIRVVATAMRLIDSTERHLGVPAPESRQARPHTLSAEASTGHDDLRPQPDLGL